MAQADPKTRATSGTHSSSRMPDHPSDEQWIEQLRAKNEIAFQEFIDAHTPHLLKLVSRLMAFSPEVDDVMQLTFLNVWRKIDSFRGESTLKTWVSQIAIYQARNHQRSLRRWLQRSEQWLHNRDHSKGTSNTHPNAPEPSDDRWNQIQSAMTSLTYRDRELIVLHFLQDYSVREIASMQNVRDNTIEVRLHRAKSRLKQLIEAN